MPSLAGKQLTKLQLSLQQWIIDAGGEFGQDVNDRRYESHDSVLAISHLALQMATAAAAVYEMAEAAVGHCKQSAPPRPRCPACGSREYHRDGDWDNETGEQVAAYMTCRTCGHSGPIE